jgi:UDP-GlcNAc3NAcA epimerase
LNIVTVMGARPQFVKAAMVSKALQGVPGIKEVAIHTGQHYDDNMSRVFFQDLEIPEPTYNLGIGSDSHGNQTGRMLGEIEKVLLDVRPDWVVVYGDTNSTLAGALAAAKLHFPVAHVEAGLRSFNRQMPEEINRVLTDHASDLLFAPTNLAVTNLLRESIGDDRVRLVGDVMYDAALYFGSRAERESTILERLGLKGEEYILATVHRAENTDSPDRLRTILTALSKASTQKRVIFPIHPRTRDAMFKERAISVLVGEIEFIDPVGYLDMTMLEKNARLIATDSGGVQKEAFFFSVPCVTFRTETEWHELIEMGWNRLVPPEDPVAVTSAILQAMSHLPKGEKSPYGDGHAADRIANCLIDWACKTPGGPVVHASASQAGQD